MPSRSTTSSAARDKLYHYAETLRYMERVVRTDPKIRESDRKLIGAFLRHIRARGVSVGRQAKYLNELRRCAQLIPVEFSKAKRGDIEELTTRLADFEWVQRRRGACTVAPGRPSGGVIPDRQQGASPTR